MILNVLEKCEQFILKRSSQDNQSKISCAH